MAVEQLRQALPMILDDAANGLSTRFRPMQDGLRKDLVYLDEQITIVDQEMLRQANEIYIRSRTENQS